jgi:hypothetical protein
MGRKHVSTIAIHSSVCQGRNIVNSYMSTILELIVRLTTRSRDGKRFNDLKNMFAFSVEISALSDNNDVQLEATEKFSSVDSSRGRNVFIFLISSPSCGEGSAFHFLTSASNCTIPI